MKALELQSNALLEDTFCDASIVCIHIKSVLTYKLCSYRKLKDLQKILSECQLEYTYLHVS